MATVNVVYRGALADSTGKRGDTMDAATVNGVLREIKHRYGSGVFKMAKRMLIVVQKQSVTLGKYLKTPLKDGDVVEFLPICGGG